MSPETVETATREIRAQNYDLAGGGWLRQLVYTGTATGLPLNYSAVELSGDAPVFYTPPRDPESSNFGPIWDLQGRVQRDSGPIAVEYTWTLPPEPSDMPILLFFNQPETNGFAGELTAGFEGAGETAVVEGDTVVRC